MKSTDNASQMCRNDHERVACLGRHASKSGYFSRDCPNTNIMNSTLKFQTAAWTGSTGSAYLHMGQRGLGADNLTWERLNQILRMR